MDGAENQRKGNSHAPESKNYRPVPLKLGDVHSGVSISLGVKDVPGLYQMTTSWERGRPARTRPAQLRLSPPLRSTRKGTVPGPLCKGCSRFVPDYHSPLEGESQKPSRQAKADAVGGESRAPARRGHAGSLQHRPDLLKTLVRHSPLSVRVEQDITYTGFNHSQ